MYHCVDRPQCRDDPRDVTGVLHFQIDDVGVEGPFAIGELQVEDVGLVGAEDVCDGGECARLSFEESQVPVDPEVAFTAIYSKRDGIVDWRACLDPSARHVEVRTSHVGMAVDPVVMDHVLAALREQQVRRASRLADPAAEVGSLRVAHT